MNTKDEFLDKARLTKTAVREQLNQKRIKYNWHEADVSMLEGVPEVTGGSEKSYARPMKKGCLYDSWVNSLRIMYGWKPLPNAAWILILHHQGRAGRDLPLGFP